MSVRPCSSLITWLLIAIYAGSASAQNKLVVKNDTNGFMQLWVWKERNSRWDLPPMGITRGQEKYMDTADQGKYYLVARDDEVIEYLLGHLERAEVLLKAVENFDRSDS